MSRVVVIGAGVGGLAAAARLAALGHHVIACEQAPTVGGKLGGYERDGFRFDTGPSLLTMPQVFADLGAGTGGPLPLGLRRLDPIARYHFADGTTFDARADLEAFCAELDGALGGGAGADWRRFTTRAAAIWAATRAPFLYSPLDGARTLARLALTRPRDIATISPLHSLRGLGSRYLRDPRLRMFLDRYATYTGSDPRRAPAALAVVPYVEQAFGGWYVEGGLRRLAEVIRDRATERGAVVRTGAGVVEIELAGGRTAGVRLADGARLPADIVVAGVDAATVCSHLLSAGARRPAMRARPSFSGFVLLLGVRRNGQGRTPGLAHHTVAFPADYDPEFDALAAGRVVDDPTLYLAVPDDPAVAPAGDEAWFVLVNAPRHSPKPGRGEVDWEAPGVAATYAQRLLDLLAARGYDVRDRLAFTAVRTPADLERATRSPGGAIYGASSNGIRAAFLRPANRSPVPGLFLVGGSAHPGGGLPLVALSAQIVAGLVGPA